MFLDTTTVDVNQLADQLAKIAGPIAKHGWEVYVRQQYVIGAQQLAWALLMTSVAVACLIFVKTRLWSWAANYKYRDSMDKGLAYIAPILVLCVGAAAGIVGFGCGLDGVSHFLNPEYGAIQGILGR